MPDFTSLKGVDDLSRSLLTDTLETNLAAFLTWGMLGAGGFFNVRVPTSGVYGGDQHQLRPVKDPYYQDGQVWQGFRQDWVWETGVQNARQPIRASGVFVGGAFKPATGVGAYAHHVNYPLGRVVFDSPIATTSTVTCEYTYRYAHVTTADAPWWRQVQTESFRVDHPHFAQMGSGMWSVLAQNRVQLPAIVVEALPQVSNSPLMMGGGRKARQDVLFHVLAEAPWDVKQLHDVVTYQWQKRAILFEKNWMADAGKFPLDESGSPASGALMYPDLVKGTGEGGFGWRQVRFEDFRSTSQPREVTAPLYVATVRAVVEVDMP